MSAVIQDHCFLGVERIVTIFDINKPGEKEIGYHHMCTVL